MQMARLKGHGALFRAVNEAIAAIARRYPPDVGHFEFFCECADNACAQMLALSLAEYQRARAFPEQSVVAPGHHLDEIERVVERHARYWLIDKTGEAGKLARPLDSR